ncbi:hypothetical protein QUB30_00365 [Microcoleus sp. BROC3]
MSVSFWHRRKFFQPSVTTKHDGINQVNLAVIDSGGNLLINGIWDGAMAPMGEPLNSIGPITIFSLLNQRIQLRQALVAPLI